MFQTVRLWSVQVQATGLALAAVMFALGLGVGATVMPVFASRGGTLASTAAPAPAPIPAPPSLRTAHPAEVLRVFDGDTFEARVNLWPGLDVTTRVRLRGIDAPEMKARCIEERTRAEAARDALKAILDQGEVGITRVVLEKYGGRVLADASTHRTLDVAASLLDAGHVRRYRGGRREGWC
jgi:endonuclease YncB( thermonuclease family)